MRTIRVLIVDDEPLARQRLADLVLHEPNAEVVGEADNGNDAVEKIRALRPDLIFLDVQMPGKTGLEVVRDVGPANMPATIFVTAFDQYALAAFDVAAIDYLVKPFDDERFEQAFRRARKLAELEGLENLRSQLLDVLGASREEASEPGTRGPAITTGASHSYLERIAVEMKGKVRVVPVSQIEYITASGPYAELHVGDRVFLIRESMQTLDERLDPNVFLRIHRSAIVRLDLVDTFLRAPGGDYEVQLKNGVRLRVSRSRREDLERRLGVS